MDPSKKLKTVRQAPGSSLCQAKSFLPEDCSSKVGKKYEDHLQAKTLSICPSTTDKGDDLLPQNPSKAEIFPKIPVIKWECPSSFALNSGWRIAAGEESKEKEYQKQRELRVLEAVYPRDSYIPDGPSASLDVEKECYDDSHTPLVPLIPIEEQVEVSEDIKHDVISPATLSPVNSQCSGLLSVPVSCFWEGDFKAAYEIAHLIKKHNEEGNFFVDSNIILKTISDPVVLGKIVKGYCNGMKNKQATVMPAAAQTIATSPQRATKRAAPPLERERKSCSKQARSSAGSVSSSSQPRVVKDVNYYRSLVTSSNINKPCKYFNSSRGRCRHGLKCRYKHDASVWRM